MAIPRIDAMDVTIADNSSDIVLNQTEIVRLDGEVFVLEQRMDKTLQDDSNFVPSLDNTFDIGSGTLRYASIFSVMFQGTALTALYADVAEMYETGTQLPVGTFVGFGKEYEMEELTMERANMGFGVVATNPALKMNSGKDPKTHNYISICGRTPGRLKGSVKRGDYIVASDIPGVGQALSPHAIEIKPYLMMETVARALETDEDPGIKVVEVVIGRF
ncbi:MAG: hypothetical protein DRQ88_12390 [Epsilonproteobacteria bacterium]|nr:MAG: hypothetical protein DRQ88_12390 [Campylobacterota bacterium]